MPNIRSHAVVSLLVSRLEVIWHLIFPTLMAVRVNKGSAITVKETQEKRNLCQQKPPRPLFLPVVLIFSGRSHLFRIPRTSFRVCRMSDARGVSGVLAPTPCSEPLGVWSLTPGFGAVSATHA
jgi:hypothetical protein